MSSLNKLVGGDELAITPPKISPVPDRDEITNSIMWPSHQ